MILPLNIAGKGAAMTPAELYDDHRRRPRQVGKLVGVDLVGDIGSIVVGDALRFYLKTAGELISEARFQVFNAPDQVASASVLCTLLAGRTLTAAATVGPRELCAELGGLDPHELPPRIWAIDGLHAALAARLGREPEADTEVDSLLCRCNGIHEETVRQSIAVMDLHNSEAVVAATGAGTVCGSCRADIPKLIESVHQAPAPAVVTAPAAGVRGRIPTLLGIQRLVNNRLAGAWQAQGGGLELWDFTGGHVTVRATGTFIADHGACRAAAAELETVLRAEADPGLGVIVQSP